jgi:hypothetical protein
MITNAQAEAEKKVTDAERQNAVVKEAAKTAGYDRVSAAQKEMAVYYAAMETYETNPLCLDPRLKGKGHRLCDSLFQIGIPRLTSPLGSLVSCALSCP